MALHGASERAGYFVAVCFIFLFSDTTVTVDVDRAMFRDRSFESTVLCNGRSSVIILERALLYCTPVALGCDAIFGRHTMRRADRNGACTGVNGLDFECTNANATQNHPFLALCNKTRRKFKRIFNPLWAILHQLREYWRRHGERPATEILVGAVSLLYLDVCRNSGVVDEL